MCNWLLFLLYCLCSKTDYLRWELCELKRLNPQDKPNLLLWSLPKLMFPFRFVSAGCNKIALNCLSSSRFSLANIMQRAHPRRPSWALCMWPTKMRVVSSSFSASFLPHDRLGLPPRKGHYKWGFRIWFGFSQLWIALKGWRRILHEHYGSTLSRYTCCWH